MDFFETVWNFGLFGYYGQNIGILFYVFGLMLSAGLGYLAGGLNVTCFLFKFRFKENIWENGRGTYLVDMKREHGLLPVFASAVGDIFKTLLAVFVFGILFGGIQFGMPLASVFCLLGDVHSPFLKFKGGNGILCASIIVLVTDPLAFGIIALLFFIIVLVSKYISLGYFISFMAYPLILYRNVGPGFTIIGALIIAAIVVIKNKNGISRIRNGEEKKTYIFKKSKHNNQ